MTEQGWAWPLGEALSQSLSKLLLDAIDGLDSVRLEGSSRIDGLGARHVAHKDVGLLRGRRDRVIGQFKPMSRACLSNAGT